MMTVSDVQAVLFFYAQNPAAVQRIEPVENAGGWSGSRLWRVELSDGAVGNALGGIPRAGIEGVSADRGPPQRAAPTRFALRRWPQEHPTKERLRIIHNVLKIVSADLPIVAYPLAAANGETFVEHGGHLWELTRWLPGAADYHSRPTRERLSAAMVVLSRFHLLAARYKRRRGAVPAILDRQRHWKSMCENGVAVIHGSLTIPLGGPIDARAARLLERAREALEKPGVIGSLAATGELWLQPAIRDIHHDHVLFTGDEVTGLIDFGALRIDTPLADVARLVGSLVGDDITERQFALDAYSELRPLGADERRLIDVLDYSGVVLGALNWLTWLYVERRDMGPVEPIVKRLDRLLVRLNHAH